MSKSRRGHVIEPGSEIPRLFIWLFGLVGLVAAISSIVLLAPRIIDLFTQDDLANDNRTWLTAAWTQEDKSAEEVKELVRLLDGHRITAVYVQTNRWHGETGDYIELPYTQNFVQRFRNQSDTIGLYAWLIMDNDQLIDEESTPQVLAFAERAVTELGFTGIHIQVRSVPDGSEAFITLLRDLRSTIGPSKRLSISVPPDRIPADPDIPQGISPANELTWTQEYKRRVVLNANEITLMAHASGLTSEMEYERWLGYQVQTYADLLNELALDDVVYIVALPTYAAEFAHDPLVENVNTALRGIDEGTQRSPQVEKRLSGTGIYPWDEAGAEVLLSYWETWVKREN